MSFKITINNEEVVSNSNLQIKEEMLSTSSTILKNCYPKSWEDDKDYISRYYFPKDYSKCKIFNDTYHPEELGTTVKGTNLNINYDNTKNWELNGLFGDTFQQTYTGKNLLNSVPDVSSKNGVTVSYNSATQEITLNGTCTVNNTIVPFGEIASSSIYGDNTFTLPANTRLYIKIQYVSGTSEGSYRLAVFNNSFGTGLQAESTQSGVNVGRDNQWTTSVTFTKFRLRFENGTKFNNYKVKLLMSTSGYDYEPFVGRIPSPNPSYPQAIENVTGLQNIEVCGKNLLPNNATSTTLNGVTFTKNDDGTVLINGTSTATVFYNLIEDNSLPLNTNGMFLSGCPSGGSTTSYELRVTYTNNTNDRDIGNGTTLGNKTIKVVMIRLQANTTFDNLLFKPMIEKGTQSSTYEPYTGTTYEVNLGKNLFNSTIINGVVTNDNINTTSTTRICTQNFIKVQPNTTYTLSFVSSIINNYNVSYFTTNDFPRSSQTNWVNISNPTFTTPSTTNYILITFRKNDDSNVAPSDITSIQLEKGSQATSYTPYFTPIELNKIGDYEDKFFKNIEEGSGKNLLNIYDGYELGYLDNTGTLVEDSMVATFNQYIPVEEGQKYCLSLDWVVDNLYFYTYNENREFINKYQYSSFEEKYLLIPNGVSYLRVGVEDGIDAITTQLLEEMKLMVEVGETRSPYEPYLKPDTWYLEKQVSVRTLNGTENWSYSSNKRTYWLELSDIKVQNIQSNMMDIASNLNNYGTILNNDSVLSIEYGFFVNNQYIHIRNKNILNNINSFKTWLASNQVKVLIPLKETTTTEITNEELINQLENIYFNLLGNGINNVSITSENLSMPIEIHYNFKEAYTEEDLIFCGCVKNTGNISLNPREPHFVDLQLLDFKCLLSEGETLNYVITGKTIVEAINQVVSSISDYGFVVGNINILNPNDIIGAYSTLNKTAYDVFQYIADITQSRWTTRVIDENTIAIDFYDPSLMPQADPIESTQQYYCENEIKDISFSYNTNDYRNKQIMTSDEVYGNILQTETKIADGYTKTFMCDNKLGEITSITINGVEATFCTKAQEQLGVSADFIYQPGEMNLISKNTISVGSLIVITYYPIVKGREIVLRYDETARISNQIGRKGTISRYENRNDTTSSQELQKIGQSYIKYKGQAEIILKVTTAKDIWDIGQVIEYNAPIEELNVDYMVKSKMIDMYLIANKIFYTYELTSNFNYENAVNYFDNQRAKNQGNIGEGETITRNIDLESSSLIKFYDTIIEEIQVQNPTSLDFTLDGVLI